MSGRETAPADRPGRKRINLALQGGGSHGAFTWGVLDRLLEDGRLDIDGISGTSAGAVNAAVLAAGIAKGGDARARELLDTFWRKVAAAAVWSPLRPSPFDKLMSPGNMDFSPGWQWYDALTRMVSPYVTNPGGMNPLADLLRATIDFDALRRTGRVKLFLCATNVKTGRIKVFDNRSCTADSVMASACLPFLFQAVEIDGEHYWDGGFMGNPPIYPLIYGTETEDVLIVQINPINIEEVPRSAHEILDRTNELSFNSSLMREMRSIVFVQKLLADNKVPRGRYKDVKVHTIEAEATLAELGYSSKLNADLDFLVWLFNIGRERASGFLDRHFDKIGVESSTDIAATFL